MKEKQYKFNETFQIDLDGIEIDGVTYGPFTVGLDDGQWDTDPMLRLLSFFVEGSRNYGDLTDIPEKAFDGYSKSQLKQYEVEEKIPNKWPIGKVKKTKYEVNGLDLKNFKAKARVHKHKNEEGTIDELVVEAVVRAEESTEDKFIQLEYTASLGDVMDLGEYGSFAYIPSWLGNNPRCITDIVVSIGAKTETDFRTLKDRVKTILGYADLYEHRETKSDEEDDID